MGRGKSMTHWDKELLERIVESIKTTLEANGFEVKVDYIMEIYRGVGNAWLHGDNGVRNLEIEISETAFRGG
jgi:hypothetical protein